jgi:phage gp36-like protein
MATTNGYCSLAELKASLDITDTIDDAILERAITSASRSIDRYCARNFYKVSTTRLFAPRDSYICDIDDLVSLTTLRTTDDDNQVYDITWSETDYQLEPLNGVVDGMVTPFTRIRAIGDYTFLTLDGEATVEVTGMFGFNAVPDEVNYATMIQASKLYKRKDSPLGVISGEYGAMRVGVRLDPQVSELVDAWRRIRVG